MFVLTKPMTSIYGHRGARGLYPENTIQSFLYAAGLVLDGIELDVVISKDDKVVVSHESWMNPKTCTKPDNSKVSFLRRKNLYRMNYEDIKKYDCGLRGNSGFPEQKKMPAYKPLLAEVIEQVEAFVKQNNLPLPVYIIEIKSMWITDDELHPTPLEFVRLVLAELLPFHINNRILIQSFDMRPLNILHENNPGFMLGMLVRSPRFIKRRMKSLQFTPDTCGTNYKLTSEKWVKKIHDWGMKSLVWTENEKGDMLNHLKMGVDGIITDYPDKAIEAVKEFQKV
jgi:glycerophosphoryl diester phosphodiesterase